MRRSLAVLLFEGANYRDGYIQQPCHHNDYLIDLTNDPLIVLYFYMLNIHYLAHGHPMISPIASILARSVSVVTDQYKTDLSTQVVHVGFSPVLY